MAQKTGIMIVKRLILLLFILFPFGQLTRLPLPVSPAVRIYGHDVIVILIIVAWLISLRIRQTKLVYSPLLKPIGFFVTSALLSLSLARFRYPLDELLIGSLYLLRWILYAGLYPVVYTVARQDKKFTERLLMFLGGAGVVSALFGLMQYALYPNLRNLMYLGWDPHEYRVFAPFFDSGFTGLVYVMTLLLLAHQWMRNRRNGVLVTGMAITYTALALTYSRASFVALCAGFLVFSIFQKSIKPVAIVTLLLGATLLLLPHSSPRSEGTNLARTASAEARLSNYEQSIEIIKDHPLFGIGFNMMRYENRNRNFVPVYEWETSNAAAGLDNSLLFVWATTGVLGLISYGYLLFKAATITVKPFRVLVIATLSAVLVHSIFNNSLFYPWIMIWMWVLLGVAHVPRRL
ncbi:MAG: O-antigen ligase family protein [Candidatus Roizmanbacteria bacterium]|nr:O-antigen ligase family protein [Candidatus Roizmanbacteria bacterium]